MLATSTIYVPNPSSIIDSLFSHVINMVSTSFEAFSCIKVIFPTLFCLLLMVWRYLWQWKHWICKSGKSFFLLHLHSFDFIHHLNLFLYSNSSIFIVIWTWLYWDLWLKCIFKRNSWDCNVPNKLSKERIAKYFDSSIATTLYVNSRVRLLRIISTTLLSSTSSPFNLI